MSRLPVNPRLGHDPSAHNIRRDLELADQIVADQKEVHEEPQPTAEGDETQAVRHSETVSE